MVTMRSYRTNLPTGVTVSIMSVITFISLGATPARAQQNSAMRDWEIARARQREMIRNERELDNIGREKKVGPSAPTRPVLTQTKEDFERIQVINNEMIRLISGGDTLDYRLISNRTAEIKKRAARLKANLRFPESEVDEKGQNNRATPDGEQVKASLLTLDEVIKGAPENGQVKSSLLTLATLIQRFVTNPLFGNVRVNDAMPVAEAGRDLENIIELSSRIKEGAKALEKGAKKS